MSTRIERGKIAIFPLSILLLILCKTRIYLLLQRRQQLCGDYWQLAIQFGSVE
jgi:hypothetical protein